MSGRLAAENETGTSRHFATRIGICLLNLICPGFGLLRVGQWRLAIAYLAVQMLVILFVWLAFATVDLMSFVTYATILGVCLSLLLLAYIGTITQSWKTSAIVAAEKPWWTRWYGLAGIWLAIAIVTWPIPDLLRSYYRTFFIPAESMMPTLAVGDRFLAKMGFDGPLQRGEVVVVTAGKVDYVKRVVGVPGDHIGMRSGYIILNGKRISQRHTNLIRPADVEGEDIQYRTEQLPGEPKPHWTADTGYTMMDDISEVALGPDQYYLLGDNRDRSADSRIASDAGGLGIVARESIIGKSLFIFWRKSVGWGQLPI